MMMMMMMTMTMMIMTMTMMTVMVTLIVAAVVRWLWQYADGGDMVAATRTTMMRTATMGPLVGPLGGPVGGPWGPVEVMMGKR